MNVRLICAAALTLALSACATGPGYYAGPGPGPGYYGPPPPPGAYPTRCYSCGHVDRIEQIVGQRTSDGSGAVIGGIIGGVLGNSVGRGDGRGAATAIGVVGGAVVGDNIQKDNNAATTYDIYVHMDDGRKLIVNQRDPGGIQKGSYVSIDGGVAHLVQ